MFRKRKKLSAVLDEDLSDFLSSIGLLEKIQNGDLFCTCCGNVITLNNLQVILPKADHSFDVFCDNPDCTEASQ